MSEQKTPTKEEMISFLKEQISVKKVQLELQTLNASLAEARVNELKALSIIAQITTAPKEEETVKHTVTQSDIDNNPDMVEAGIKLGDEILIPKNTSLTNEK